MRFAICLSLRQQGIPNPDEYNKEGATFSADSIFGVHERMYLTLMINRLKNDGLDPENYLNEMTRAHLNRGMIGLKQRIKNLSDFDGLLKEVQY